MDYYVTIKKIELQENGRYRTTFNIITFPRSKTQEWKNRKWNTTFQIIYNKEFEFITIFSKNEDPSKDYVVRFMKGNFQRINENKSIPVSELLIRTLILHISEDAFPGGKHNETFMFTQEGIREISEHSPFSRKKVNYLPPIYSLGRDLWICYSFTEEKAHRIAFYNANQCNKLIVVFCNPSYTRHHRCQYSGTSIVSLYDYANYVSSEIRKKYEGQIRFLQNHLNIQDKLDSKELLKEINTPTKEIYDIKKSELMEALGVMKIYPKDDQDFFHFLCAVNLINAFLSRQRNGKQLSKKDNKLFKNMYYFKIFISDIITDRIKNKNFSTPIYITRGLIMVDIFGFQFSFHYIPFNQTIINYEKSYYNKEIIWSGKRLQPLAPLLFNYSRAIRLKTQNHLHIPH